MTDSRDQHTRFTLHRGQETRSQRFEKLYLENYNFVYNHVRYRMSGADEAEDVVAEAFMLAARSFDKFDPSRAKFSTWVIAIANNCMNSYYRKVYPTVTIDEVPESSLSASGEWQDGYTDHELVRQLLEKLTPEERELVLLKYREGLRNVDIAEQLQMNASTVSTKLAHALAKMRTAAERS